MRIPIRKSYVPPGAIVRAAMFVAACLALLTCTAPDFGPPSTGEPLTISPLQPEVTAGMTFTFQAAGGAPPYRFSSTGNGTVNASTGRYTAADSPGSATIKVTDQKGQTATTSVTVHPAALYVVPANPTLEANVAYTFAGHGGTPPYAYSETGAGTINPSTGVYSSPVGGNMTVTVTDSALVTSTTSVHVNDPVYPLQISPTSAVVETNVDLQFTSSGGEGVRTYSVVGKGSINASTGLYSSGGSAGSATVTVEDSASPTHHVATATVTINNPPPPLALSPSSATIVVGGTRTFTASGGTPPYTFSKVSGVGSIESSTGLYSAGTNAGSAVVQVADSKSRTLTAPITVKDELGITPSATSVTINGEVTLFASGGVSPYATWSVSGSAGGSVDPTSGATVVYTAPGSTGIDTVTVTDSQTPTPNTADCTITVTPAALVISPASITIQAGNSVDFNASGGSSYTFSVFSGVGSINSSSGLYTSAVEGTAVVRVTDNYSRTQDASVTVNATPLVLSPSSITIQAGGSVTFAADGGTPPYAYSKVSGVGSIGSSDGIYTSASSGSATVKVTDSKSRTDTAAVTVEPPPAPPLNLSPVVVNVQTGSDQTFAATGGTTPYTWTATAGSITPSGVYTAPSSVPLSPTAYKVRVTDAAAAFQEATVNVYAPLVFTTQPATIDAGAQFDFDAAGGIAPLVFSVLDGGGSINSGSGLYTSPGAVGVVTVRVTDNQGKFADWSFAVIDPAAWGTKQTIDAARKSGQYASLALTSAGVPVIAYWEAQVKALKVAVGPSWNLLTVDSNNGGDQYASLALDSDDDARVAWYDAGSKDLKYRAWNGTGWESEITVDGAGTVGQYASLALDGSGFPRIAYYDASNRRLKYAAWNGASWTLATVPDPDSGHNVGQYASLALDNTGNPHIAYYDATSKRLKHAWWNGTWQTEVVDESGDDGQYASLKVNSSGQPRIAYYESVDATHGKLKYAAWNGASWDIEIIDAAANKLGQYASLALDPSDSHPLIAYYDATNTNLKYAELNATVWLIATVDASSSNVGQYASLAVSAAGRMRIAYYNATSQDLQYIEEQ
jgi:plastocyanin